MGVIGPWKNYREACTPKEEKTYQKITIGRGLNLKKLRMENQMNGIFKYIVINLSGLIQ